MSTGSERLREIVGDYLQRRAAGEDVSVAALVRGNPELEPHLEVELRRAGLIAAARQTAAGHTADETPDAGNPRGKTPEANNLVDGPPKDAVETAAVADEFVPASPGLQIHCPRCQRRMDTPVDASWRQLECSHCGNSFSLTGDDGADNFSPGHQIGHFELLAKLGEGGFGAVWTARDTELDRLVAVKMPRRGSLSAADAEFFLREARAAAQLHHPHIVAVHEVGRDGDTVYIVSELVHGVSLADWAHGPVEPRQAAALCETIAGALHHAHQAGVIHRDLKPSNVLIDAEGKPHLVDFGLAKRETAETTRTATGQMMGTPAYMSPEQARGAAHECTAQSDVYSLGVVLYELLTGEVPFRGNARMMLAQILGDDPPSPRKFVPETPRDLETICLKCLEKDAARRYSSAAALADDLQKHLAGIPIAARPIGRLERGWRWCRRKPLAATLAALLATLAIIGPLIALRQTRLADEADVARQNADEQSRLATNLAQQEAAARHTAEQADRRTYRQLYVANMAAIPRAVQDRDYARAIQLLSAHLPTAGRDDVRGIEWFHWWKYCHRGLVKTEPFAESLWDIVTSPDGRWAAVAIGGRRIGIVDITTGALLKELGDSSEDMSSLAFTSDGATVYAGYRNGNLAAWDIASRSAARRRTAHDGAVNDIVVLPDGKVLTCGDDGQVKSWDAAFQQSTILLKVREGMACQSIAVSSDGVHLATCAMMRLALISDPVSMVALYERDGLKLRQEWTLPRTEGRQVVFSPDGRWLAAGLRTAAPQLWDVRAGTMISPLAECGESIQRIAFSPDSKTLAGAPDHGGGVCIWNVSTRKLDSLFAAHPHVASTAWRKHDAALISVGRDRRLRIWSPKAQVFPERIAGHIGNVDSCSLSTDGKTLVAESSLETTFVFDLPSRKLRRALPLLTKPLVAPDGRSLVAVRRGNTVVRVDLVGNAPMQDVFVTQGKIGGFAFSPCSTRLFVGEQAKQWTSTTADADLVVVDMATGKEVQRLDKYKASVSALSCTPDGRRLVAGLHRGDVHVYDLVRGIREHLIKSQQFGVVARISCVASSNALAAVGTLEGTTVLIDLTTGAAWQTFTSFGGRINALAFSRDGKTLAAAIGNFGVDNSPGGVRLWDLETGESKGLLATEDGSVRDVILARDGRTLITGHNVHRLLVWPGATDDEVAGQGQ